MTAWLLLCAFAAGCTAMTGVGAVSNGVTAFKEPTVKYAHRTLAAICAVLGLLLLGIAYLAQAYGIVAMDQAQYGYQSVISQLVSAAWGRDWVYFVTIGSVLAVLCLSANTSFVGFPRLCRQVASDGYLPKTFAMPGRRLVYTAGVLFLPRRRRLADRVRGHHRPADPALRRWRFPELMLSQAGMAAHWRREGRGHADRVRLWVNGLGALATGAALLIILLAKFVEGAWLTIVVIPLTLLLLKLTRRYYEDLDRQLLSGARRRLDLRGRHAPPLVVIPIARWDRISQTAMAYAMRLSPDVTALHCTDLEGPEAEEHETHLRDEWAHHIEQPAIKAGLPAPRLLVVPSPYRSVLAPLLRVIQDLRRDQPGRPVAVVLPQLVEARWWEVLLHTHRERRLRRALQRQGGPDLPRSPCPGA